MTSSTNYGSGVAPDGASSYIPIQVDGDSATVTIHIGRLTFQALIDTGATSMSLPETAVENLLDSGDAVAGETINVQIADGVALRRQGGNHKWPMRVIDGDTIVLTKGGQHVRLTALTRRKCRMLGMSMMTRPGRRAEKKCGA